VKAGVYKIRESLQKSRDKVACLGARMARFCAGLLRRRGLVME